MSPISKASGRRKAPACLAHGPYPCTIVSGTAPSPLRFRRTQRLSGADAFSRVFKTGLRKGAGPFMLIALPNGTPHHRLGLSVGKRVGGAVRRVAVKRRIREAFRLLQHDLPNAPTQALSSDLEAPGYDWVVAVRPHPPMPTEGYREALLILAQRVSREWHKRADKAAERGNQ